MRKKANYELLPDAQLVDLLRLGDSLAFTEIYNRYQKLLYVYAFRKLKDKDEAKDIIQDVYVALWNTKETFDILTTLSGYLYKAVLNRALNAFRHKKIDESHIESFIKIIETNAATTDYLIREKDISELIDKEVSLLPGKMREIFELRRKHYMSNKDIAEHLDISEHTVSTQMKRALKILKDKFGLIIYIAWLFRW